MTRREFLWLLSLIGCKKEELKVNPARSFFFAISSAPASVYSAEYQAVLDYADAQTALGVTEYEKPVVFDREQEDALVRLLVSSGAFALADQIFNLSATGGRKFAMINIKNPGTYNGSLPATNSLWRKGVGFYGDGISKYFRTNFIPGTNGVNYTLNSAGIFISIVNDTGTSSVVDFGATDDALTNSLLASIRNTGNNLAFRVNTSTSATASNTDAAGKYVISRSASNATKAYKNGVQIGSTSTVASTAITSREIYLNNYNNGSAPTSSTKMTGFWLIGGALDAIAASLNTYLSSFETTTLTVTTPSFADKTSVSNYISSISQLPASFEYGEPQQSSISCGTNGQWFSGALASNGKIYCPPGSSTVAIKIDTSNQTATTFGSFISGSFKYGGAVFANGSIYFVPASSNSIAKINISTDAITFIDSTGVIASEGVGNLGATTQKWYGGRIGADGRIYCTPYNATSVLIIDPTTDAVSFIDTTGVIGSPSGNLTDSQKWDTGCNYGNYIYGVPSDVTDILKIDTLNGTCSRILTGQFPSGSAKWALSCVAPNGYLYFFPYFRNQIVKFDPSNDTFSYLAATIGTTDIKIKVVGVSIRPDGKFHLVMHDPSYTEYYTFDPATDTLASFPRLLNEQTNGCILASDGRMYSPPASSTSNIQVFSFPRRTISLPDNFTDNRHVACY